jgi:hypothetical protein
MKTIYNFEGVPQSHRYVKVHNLFCNNDKQALQQARRLNKRHEYQVVPGRDGQKFVTIKPNKDETIN